MRLCINFFIAFVFSSQLGFCNVDQKTLTDSYAQKPYFKLERSSTYTYRNLLQNSPLSLQKAIESGIDFLLSEKQNPKNLHFTTLLGGFSSSQLYLFSIGQERYVLRIIDPRNFDNPELTFYKRMNEVIAHQEASYLGIAPEMVYSDADALIIIMKYIEGHTVSKKDFFNKKILSSLGKAIKKIHDISPELSKSSVQLDRAAKHYNKAKSKGIAFPSGFQELYDQFESEMKRLQDNKVFCHGDLHPGNILVKGEELYFIDWQKATYDNSYGDLGYFALLSGMNEEQAKIFLKSYLGREPSTSELRELELAQARTCFLTSIVWFGFLEEEDVKVPLQLRVNQLDELLAHPSLKTGKEYIFSGDTVNPLIASKKDVLQFALAFLKEYLIRIRKLEEHKNKKA